MIPYNLNVCAFVLSSKGVIQIIIERPLGEQIEMKMEKDLFGMSALCPPSEGVIQIINERPLGEQIKLKMEKDTFGMSARCPPSKGVIHITNESNGRTNWTEDEEVYIWNVPHSKMFFFEIINVMKIEK